MYRSNKIILLVLLISFILSGCGSSKTAEKENGTGNTIGNIVNYGSAAEYKGDVYCQYGDKGEKFVKMAADGTVTVLKEAQPYFINIVDDTIYYVDANDGFKLHSMSTDGSGDKSLTESPAYYVNVADDYIYYSNPDNDYNLYRMNREELEPKMIVTANCQYINVVDNSIYYTNFSNGGTIYRCDLTGENDAMINRAQSLYLNVVGDKIYYSEWHMENKDDSDQRLYCLDLKTGEKKALNDCKSGDINVYKDKIYYTDWDNNKIRVMDIDGGNDREYDDYGTYINIAGGKMFCIRYAEKTKEISFHINDLKE